MKRRCLIALLWVSLAVRAASAAAPQLPPSPVPAAEIHAKLASGQSEDEASRQALADAKSGALGFDTLVMVQRKPLNPTHVYTYHVEGLERGGGLYTLALKEGKLTRLVDASDGVILDCQGSYDGKQVLFSWKRTMQEPFTIWRINADGSGLTCVIDHDSNNMNACWLPDGGIAFLSDRKPAFAYCWTSTSPVLFRSDGNGRNVIKLSANYLTDFTPSIMSDGRILYSRWEYVDRPAIPIQSLWAIHPDGTMLSGVFGNRVLSPATFMEARDIPGMPGRILCMMTSHNGPCRGAIGLLDVSQGGNAQEAIRNLTPEISVGPVADAGAGNAMRGPYESPVPLDARYYLVSRQGVILLRDYAGTANAVLWEPDKDMGFYSAQPLRRRPRPRSLQPTGADLAAGPWATVIMHNVKTGLGDAVKQGEVKRIAVVQEMEKDMRAEIDKRQFGFQFPVVSCGATYAPKRVWGFADVEADGSAHFKVPSGVPLYFLPLDAEGRAVQRMRSFTHFMPGERQSCIGCHADRNYVSPAGLQGGRSLAAARPAQELIEPEWGRRDGFSFARVVQPVLDARCVRCHDENSKLDLSGDRTDYFNVAYENLARRGTQAEHGGDAHGGMPGFGRNPYTSWIPSFNGCEANILQIEPKTWGSPVSLLAGVVTSGHPDAEGRQRIALSPGERLRILMWIDLNVPFYGTSQSRQPELRGCRQILPKDLDAVLTEVAARRGINLPRTFYVRLDHPGKNPFLALPLAKGEFASADDPDYQRILACFAGVQAALSQRNDVDYRTVLQACDNK
jgi:mono/diheme cytochrome c family protein